MDEFVLVLEYGALYTVDDDDDDGRANDSSGGLLRGRPRDLGTVAPVDVAVEDDADWFGRRPRPIELVDGTCCCWLSSLPL